MSFAKINTETRSKDVNINHLMDIDTNMLATGKTMANTDLHRCSQSMLESLCPCFGLQFRVQEKESSVLCNNDLTIITRIKGFV